MGGVEPADPPDDQPGADPLGFATAGERGERGERRFGDLGIGNPAVFLFVVDRIRVADRYPRGLVDPGDRPGHRWGQSRGDGEPGSRSPRRGDDVISVVSGVGSQNQQPARAGTPGADQRIGNQSGRATHRVRRPFTQPGRHDHRRRDGSGHNAQQRVEPVNASVATPGALFGVAVSRPHGVVDIDVAHLVDAAQDRSRRRQATQQHGGDRVEWRT